MVCSQTREVSEAISRKDFEKAMSLRDPEFRDSLEGFFVTATLEAEKLLPESKVRGLFSASLH
jgi:6-phosphofructokinase 1